MKLRLRWVVAVVTALASVTLVAQRSLLNTGLVIDGNGNLLVTNNAQSGSASGARSAANTLVKTDANGYLMVAMGASTVALPVTGPGTSLLPAITVAQTNKGLWSSGTDQLAISVAGTQSVTFFSTGETVNGNLVLNNALILNATQLLFGNTAPTVTSAGTSPTISGNGTATFRVNVGTGGTATTIVLGMPAATTGWNCVGSNLTAAAANRNPTGVLLEQSSTTTAVTLQYQTVATGVALAFTASDIVLINCLGF